MGTKKPFIISSRIGSEACRSPQNTPVIKNPGSEVLKELKGWINYNPALYYPTLKQNKKLYTKLYELPHIFFFLGPHSNLEGKARGHLTSTKLLRILALKDELLLQASPRIKKSH